MANPKDSLMELDAPPGDLLGEKEEQAEPEVLSASTMIPVNYQLGDGTLLEGAITFRVPTVRDMRWIGMRRHQLAMGKTGELDLQTLELCFIIAYCESTMTDGRKGADAPPDWFREPSDCKSVEVLHLIYGEAAEYAERFRGRGRDLRQSPS